MKHDLKITVLLIALFLAAQFIGLAVTKNYITEKLPYNIETPKFEEKTSFIPIFIIIIAATIFALLIAKMEATIIWKVWFFVSVTFCMSVALSAFTNQAAALVISAGLAVFKVVRRSIIVHNATELFIYGGLAAILVPVLGIVSISALLILISVYDYIAVRKTKHMVALAKFQAKIRIFAGFLIPYGKNKEAILGGGDIGFPLMFSAVAMKTLGIKAMIIPVFAAMALAFLFIRSEKKKFYPAMPILSIGCFIGYGIALLL